MQLRKLLVDRKYELLLFALIQHLFIGIFLSDLVFYRDVIWPINMLILGVFSMGVFVEKGRWKNVVRNILFVLVLALPICIPFFGQYPHYFFLLSLIYVLFFVFIFWEIMKFLIKPSYINIDIISASACGYLLLIEISVFLMQILYYSNPDSFKGINSAGNSQIYIDLVYFASVTITSIGFGDLTPNSHHTKLITSLIGIVGQFYSVVLIGIIISKFSSKSDTQ
jgi:hypothetical protein